jgi:hypothetical protein
MNPSRLWIVASIIAVLILASFVLQVPHTRDILENSSLSSAPTTTPAVTLRDTFKKGKHTITGSIDAPNPCTSLTTNVTLVGSASTTENIQIDITIPPDSGVCLQQVSKLPFSASIAAPADLPIIVTVNGIVATTIAP